MPNQNLTVFRRKKIATQVKHRILENCLKAWGGIIITSNAGRTVRLAFVDTCCGSGLYAPSNDDEAGYDVGSALIGLDVLGELLDYGQRVGRELKAKALFINEQSPELATLRAAITEFETAIPFETIDGSLEHATAEIRSFCLNHFAFILIDPYGPSAIPFSVVSSLVKAKFSDTLINFPYYSIQKWVGWLDSGEQEGRLKIVDALLNGPEWRDIARKHRHSGAVLEDLILNHYIQQLSSLGVGAFALRMSFEDRNRTMYHLVFTSRNTAGLAAAKKELQHGEAFQAALKAELRSRKQSQGMFDFMGSEIAQTDLVDLDGLANEILKRFKGQSPTFDEVLRYGLSRPHVLDSHVGKALTVLKKSKMAKASGHRYRDTIAFAS